MNAYEMPGLRFSLVAGAAVSIHRFVNADSNGNGVHAAAGGTAIGVSRNQAALGEAITLADGIVIVEAGAQVNAGSVIQSDASGRAIHLAAGIPLGTALTAAAGVGNFVAVKLPVSGAVGAVTVNSTKQLLSFLIEDLAAGADIADKALLFCPTGFTFKVTSALVISHGSPAGVDDDNTSVLLLEKEGATKICDKTFDTANVFPAINTTAAFGAVVEADSTLVAGEALTLSATNGATANLPAFSVQIFGILAAV